MKRVLLLRHAKSDWATGAMRDHDRPLAPRGHRAAAAIGQYMKEKGFRPDLVYCSSALRTRETWLRLMDAGDLAHVPMKVVGRLYDAPVTAVMDVIRSTEPSVTSILVVGHEPAMSDALLEMTAHVDGPYPTGTLCCIDFSAAAHWADCSSGLGVLVDRVEPRSLAGGQAGS